MGFEISNQREIYGTTDYKYECIGECDPDQCSHCEEAQEVKDIYEELTEAQKEILKGLIEGAK